MNYERLDPAQGYVGSLTGLDAALNNRELYYFFGKFI